MDISEQDTELSVGLRKSSFNLVVDNMTLSCPPGF